MYDEVLTTPSLLVAMPQLQDPNFHHAVVLLVEHNEQGALGFVCNNPAKQHLKDILIESDMDVPDTVPTWWGGPVGTDNGLILRHAEDSDTSDEENIGRGLMLSSSQYSMIKLIKYHLDRGDKVPVPEENLYPYRFLVGYAGWGAGQLDEELRIGSWIQLPLDFKLLFQTPGDKMWDVAIASLGVRPGEITQVVQEFLN